jgi:predicted Zn-dependent protease
VQGGADGEDGLGRSEGAVLGGLCPQASRPVAAAVRQQYSVCSLTVSQRDHACDVLARVLEALATQSEGSSLPAWVSTHPQTQERIAAIRGFAE